jgi:hypothetical protein
MFKKIFSCSVLLPHKWEFIEWEGTYFKKVTKYRFCKDCGIIEEWKVAAVPDFSTGWYRSFPNNNILTKIERHIKLLELIDDK